MNRWVQYFFELSPEQKAEYVQKNPEPEGWPNWYRAIEQIEKTRREDDAWFASQEKNGNPI